MITFEDLGKVQSVEHGSFRAGNPPVTYVWRTGGQIKLKVLSLSMDYEDRDITAQAQQQSNKQVVAHILDDIPAAWLTVDVVSSALDADREYAIRHGTDNELLILRELTGDLGSDLLAVFSTRIGIEE